MATKKPAVPIDEKLEDQDLNIFDVLAALDRKDYDYYDKLSESQRKKFSPFIIIQWMSAIKANAGLQSYYLMNTDYSANKYLFNEYISKHPKLQWQMLCAASPGMGKQFHQWIPSIGSKVAKLETPAKLKDIKERLLALGHNTVTGNNGSQIPVNVLTKNGKSPHKQLKNPAHKLFVDH